MTQLTTKVSASGTLAVYSGRAKIGYYVDGGDGRHHWELILVSEQLAGHPRGVSTSRELALAQIESMFSRWCAAAGVARL